MTRSSNARMRASRKAPTLLRAIGGQVPLRWVVCAIGLAIATLHPAALAAQSLFGCRDLSSAQTPTLEGRQGVFFRIDPDLLTYNRFSDEIVASIGVLSRNLAEKGTTLIVVPVPAKALAMPQFLGPDTAAYGYDPALALTIYEDTLARLKSAGVEAIDARHALRTSVSGEMAFFMADPRLTNAGLLALAQEIAGRLHTAPANEGTAVYVSEPTGARTLPSQDRLNLQMHCLTPLPDVTTMGFETVGEDPAPAEGATPVIVVGTELTGAPELNFAGFLSELSGLKVDQLSVPGDPIAALSAYLTSEGYLENQPEFLVWEVPSWANLGLRGDQPLREVTAAARNDCSEDLVVTQAAQNRVRVDLSGIAPDGTSSLRLDTGAGAPARADFHFVSKTGAERTRPVMRAEGQPLTGRFFMPLTGLWPDGTASVEIETVIDPDALPQVALCRG
ncbi:alginate O-acetyltransferase AlgX-related protein [Defluviimonas sp. SAOS-178_SWC]|uniref:alginate O-acetyltransferase AlgX-related protein n=1 Tax=Defluviimonas sp. SAOS-178_SWC TaxID=3121287 RepID=UPI003221F853